MSACECPYLPEKYHFVYYGIPEPGSMQEYNPWCPEHGHLHDEARARTIIDDYIYQVTGLTPMDRALTHITGTAAKFSDIFSDKLATLFAPKETA